MRGQTTTAWGITPPQFAGVKRSSVRPSGLVCTLPRQTGRRPARDSLGAVTTLAKASRRLHRAEIFSTHLRTSRLAGDVSTIPFHSAFLARVHQRVMRGDILLTHCLEMKSSWITSVRANSLWFKASVAQFEDAVDCDRRL